MLRSHLVIFLIFIWSFSAQAIVELEDPDNSIIGQLDYDGSYPYMVSIRASVVAEDHYCGGTLLSERWILTAAHCLVKSDSTQEGSTDNTDNITNYDVAKPIELSVTQGVADLAQTEISNLYRVTHIVIHPDYYPVATGTTTAYQNDIALLYIERDVEQVSVPPVYASLVDSDSYDALLLLGGDWEPGAPASNVKVIGWGDGDSTEVDPPVGASNTLLYETDIAFNPVEDCYARVEAGRDSPLYIASETDPTKLCTMSTQVKTVDDKVYGNGACIGDSGGPLLRNGVQVGIISASPVVNTVCSSPTIPAWYTNVHHYLDWISSYVDASAPPSESITKPNFLANTNTVQTPNELQQAHPYIVSVRASVYADEHYCGGTAISDRWVLTAAHCLVKSDATQEGSSENPDNITSYDVALPIELSVTQGVGDLADTTFNELFNVTHVVIHPDYYPEASATTTAYQNDIALLYVGRDMPTPSFATLVDAPAYTNLLALGEVWDPANRQANLNMLGWGDDNSALREIGLAFDPIADCYTRVESGRESPFYIASEVDPTKICTMSTELISEVDKLYGSGACIGDPGGPLLHEGVQVGIISASPVSSTICSSASIPAWHTNINHYLEWIASYRDAAEPPEEAVIKPTFLTTTTDPGDGGGDVGGGDTPVDDSSCNSGVGVGVGGGTTDIGCASSNGGESGSLGLFSMLSLLLLWRRRSR